jgi:hypothetical protein
MAAVTGTGLCACAGIIVTMKREIYLLVDIATPAIPSRRLRCCVHCFRYFSLRAGIYNRCNPRRNSNERHC